jgi:hypothetical protein
MFLKLQSGKNMDQTATCLLGIMGRVVLTPKQEAKESRKQQTMIDRKSSL